MIARVWRTGIDPERAAEYDVFAAERSAPMFRRQDGIRAVFFVRTATGRAVISVWRDLAAVEALGQSSDYLETVEAIRAADFLRPPWTVELLPVDNAWLAPDLV